MTSGVHSGDTRVDQEKMVEFIVSRGGELGLYTLKDIAVACGFNPKYFWNLHSIPLKYISQRTLYGLAGGLKLPVDAIKESIGLEDTAEQPGPDGAYRIANWQALADLIYFRGEAAGLMSSYAISKKCGVSAQHLAHIERGGHKTITIDAVQKLAKGFGMTQVEFVKQAELAR